MPVWYFRILCQTEKVRDGRRMKRLVRRAEENMRVKRVLGDGAFDSKANFFQLPCREAHQGCD